MSYTLLGTYRDLATFLTPYGQQPWTMCRTRKAFTCVRTGKGWPAGTLAWRPAGNPRNRYERIAVDGLLDTRSIAHAVRGKSRRQRLVRALAEAERPTMLSRLSRRARLSPRVAHRVLDGLIRDGLVRIEGDVESTADWYQGDGRMHDDMAIAFRENREE